MISNLLESRPFIKNTIRLNGVPRVTLDAPTFLVLTLLLRSVPPVRKVQEHRDAAVSQQLLLSDRQGGSGAMSDFAKRR